MPRDVFAILKADHRAVLALFDEIERAGDPAARRAALARLRAEIAAHAEAERTVLYGRLRRDPLTRELVLQSEEEHHVVGTLLRELGRMRPHGDRFVAKLRVLREAFRRHADEEESALYPRARQVLSTGEANELGARFEAHKAVPSP